LKLDDDNIIGMVRVVAVVVVVVVDDVVVGGDDVPDRLVMVRNRPRTEDTLTVTDRKDLHEGDLCEEKKQKNVFIHRHRQMFEMM